MLFALVNAAQRGVQVKILTAGKCDVPLINAAANYIYAFLLRHNIAIHEMASQELHAKTYVIDGKMAMVGSYNLDMLSYKRLLEVSLVTSELRLAQQLESHFQQDLLKSPRVDLQTYSNRPWYVRLGQYTAFTLFMAMVEVKFL